MSHSGQHPSPRGWFEIPFLQVSPLQATAFETRFARLRNAASPFAARAGANLAKDEHDAQYRRTTGFAPPWLTCRPTEELPVTPPVCWDLSRR